jgi:methionyl-tRNA synthetase
VRVIICGLAEEANRYIEVSEPWRLGHAERGGDAAAAGWQLDTSLALLAGVCAELGRDLAPFVPGLAARVRAACDDSAGRLPAAKPVFPRIG